jgi:hypothetical protein
MTRFDEDRVSVFGRVMSGNNRKGKFVEFVGSAASEDAFRNKRPAATLGGCAGNPRHFFTGSLVDA